MAYGTRRRGSGAPGTQRHQYGTAADRGILTVAGMTIAALAACAVGPSTRVAPVTTPVVQRTADTVPTPARVFLDSLSGARQADLPDSAPHAVWHPVPLPAHGTRAPAWSAIVRDPTLLALVDTALANNRDLRTAEARVREYRASRGVALGGLFPQISATGTAQNVKTVFGGTTPLTYHAVTATANLAWELDFWGRLRRQVQASGFDLAGREEEMRAATLTLVSDVATTYLELRAVDEDLRIAEQTLVSRRATLALARRRFGQGLISELDVRQFEAQVAEPAASVADFGRQRTQLENALSLLLGTRPQSISRGLPLGDIVQAVAVPDSLPGALIARRPDVMRAQRDYQAAAARVGVAIADRLPTISVGGQYGTERPNTDGLFTPRGEIYTLQAGVSIPLFTGGSLASAERAARARAAEAKAQYQQVTLAALREASDALAAVRFGRDQLVAQATQTRALEAAYEIAERRYRTGISSYLEVLDAQRTLFAAQLSYVQVEQQYLAATVQLYKALGGSWTTQGP